MTDDELSLIRAEDARAGDPRAAHPSERRAIRQRRALLAHIDGLLSRRGAEEERLAEIRRDARRDSDAGVIDDRLADVHTLLAALDHATDTIHDLLTEDANAAAYEAGANEERARVAAEVSRLERSWIAGTMPMPTSAAAAAAMVHLAIGGVDPLPDPLPPATARAEAARWRAGAERLRAALETVLEFSRYADSGRAVGDFARKALGEEV